MTCAAVPGFTVSYLTRRLVQAGMLVGLVAFAGGVLVSPPKAWTSVLLGSCLIVCLGLAGIFIVALVYTLGASWGVAIRRVPEAMACALPYGAVGLAAVFIFYPSLYPWIAGSVQGVPLTGVKKLWLNFPFFIGRALVYLVTWIGFTVAIVRRSRLQDADGLPKHTARNVRLSIAFLIVFAFSFWLAATDWIMSLDPLWYSTIFAVYNFCGLLTSGLAMTILCVLWLRKSALSTFVRQEHLEDLGRLLFGFTTFWMYIWFCQYMLIWYANIPEETEYFASRISASWLPLFLANLFLNWLIPFALLLPNVAKRSERFLTTAAIVVLAGRFVDLFLMVAPGVYGEKPAIGALELGVAVGAASVFLWAFIRHMQQAAAFPVNDPLLAESLRYRI